MSDEKDKPVAAPRTVRGVAQDGVVERNFHENQLPTTNPPTVRVKPSEPAKDAGKKE
jgi:hypothetical protein